MARGIHNLSARTVATARKRGYYGDGGGLWLQVSAFGTKSWTFRFTLNGRSREMGLGPLHTVSLAEARIEAQRCRQLVRSGIDPIEHRKMERLQAAAESAKTKTFKSCAEDYIAAHEAAWKNDKHRQQWQNTLTTYAYPTFGDLSVSAVDTGLVLNVLEPIWTEKPETASRVRGRIESILDYATARGYRSGENPARWKGHLKNLLPARSKVRRVTHHPALPYDEIGNFIMELRKRDAIAARGLEFAILTATRTGEVIGARWDEIDLGKSVWTIPGDRMKSGQEHRVPLSKAAVSLLEALPRIEGTSYVFPGTRRKRPLSNMSLLMLLRRMGRDDLTTHGFRSTFRDWCAERTSYPAEVAEMALAHAISDKVQAAYLRGDLLKKRQRLMDDWARFCAQPSKKDGSVVSLRTA